MCRKYLAVNLPSVGRAALLHNPHKKVMLPLSSQHLCRDTFVGWQTVTCK